MSFEKVDSYLNILCDLELQLSKNKEGIRDYTPLHQPIGISSTINTTSNNPINTNTDNNTNNDMMDVGNDDDDEEEASGSVRSDDDDQSTQPGLPTTSAD